jgi:hypothetical protein
MIILGAMAAIGMPIALRLSVLGLVVGAVILRRNRRLPR